MRFVLFRVIYFNIWLKKLFKNLQKKFGQNLFIKFMKKKDC